MSPGIRRPVLVVGIMLAAAGYAATKEWEWQSDADALPLLQVSQIDAGRPRAARRELAGRGPDGSARPDLPGLGRPHYRAGPAPSARKLNVALTGSEGDGICAGRAGSGCASRTALST